MLSLPKPLAKCNIDGHYKNGQSLKTNFNKRYPYGHTVYIAEGNYPQWTYFVVCDPVEAMPPGKSFFSLLVAILSSASYALNEIARFTRLVRLRCM